MDANFPAALRALLNHEGGFVNHPSDPGGITNLGVTKVVWEEWVRHPVTAQDMRGLTPEKVLPLYKRKYWDRVNGDALPSGVDYVVFDAAVNSGPGRAVKWLQEVLSVPQTGAVDAATLAKLKAVDLKQLVGTYNAARLLFLQKLPTWKTFGNGWARRVAEVGTTATKMIG